MPASSLVQFGFSCSWNIVSTLHVLHSKTRIHSSLAQLSILPIFQCFDGHFTDTVGCLLLYPYRRPFVRPMTGTGTVVPYPSSACQLMAVYHNGMVHSPKLDLVNLWLIFLMFFSMRIKSKKSGKRSSMTLILEVTTSLQHSQNSQDLWSILPSEWLQSYLSRQNSCSRISSRNLC